MRYLAPAFLAAACTGCIVYPKQNEVYDPTCRITSHKLTLEAEFPLGDCNLASKECLVIIAGSAVLSTVMSGSVVIVGNTIYWLEKQGHCLRKGGA